MLSADEQSEKLPRNLGYWGLWMLVVNGLIGAGIFGLPSGAYQLAGEYSIWIYLICAVLILPIVLCFAELGSYFKGTGGPIRYGTEAFGSFIGYQSGWLYYIARLISFSANSVLLVDSIAYFYDPVGEGSFRLVALALIIGSLTLVNMLGSLESIRSLALFTILKFSVLILLVIAGVILLGDRIIPDLSQAAPSGTDIGAATLLLIYAFVGFESAIVPAGEAKNPTRHMPLAFIGGLAAVAGLYIMVQLVAQATVSDLGASTAPLLDASSALLGHAGAVILMIGVVTSVAGNLIGAIFSTPRITYALSLQGSLPDWFGKVHPKFLTPANSVLFFGILAFIASALGSFTLLAAMTVLARAFLYIISCAAIPKLRPRYLEKGIFQLRGGYLIPVLGIIACIWLMFQVSFQNIWMTALFIAIGTGLYALGRWQRHQSTRQD